MGLRKILELSSLHGFFKGIRLSGQKVPEWFHFGPAGELLSYNIQQEWIYSNVTAREPNTVFQHHSPKHSNMHDSHRLKDAYSECKNLNNGKLPFGLVEARGEQEREIGCCPDVAYTKETIDECTPKQEPPTQEAVETVDPCQECCADPSMLLPRVRHPLRYFAFTSKVEGAQFFYRWQQHRVMWWRKFSMDPGRFSLVERKDELGRVDIQVDFSWGSVIVETIRNHGVNFFRDLQSKDLNDFEILDNRKRGLPYVLESTCTLEAAVLTYLSDGYLETDVFGVPRQQFMLHRKLAPFKMSFAAAPTSSQNNSDICDLSTYLGQELRKSGVSTLIPNIKQSLELQLARSDSFAVPYVLILTPVTLTSGIALLRSQQTATQEEMHITNLVTYVEQLTKTCV